MTLDDDVKPMVGHVRLFNFIIRRESSPNTGYNFVQHTGLADRSFLFGVFLLYLSLLVSVCVRFSDQMTDVRTCM